MNEQNFDIMITVGIMQLSDEQLLELKSVVESTIDARGISE